MLPKISRSLFDIPVVNYPTNPYLNSWETAIVIALVRSVAPRVVIEIGCNTGMTARAILNHVPSIETYIGVDVPPDHRPTLACQNDEVPRSPGYMAANDPRFCTLVRARGSLDLTPDDLEPCDAMFIDGDHSAAAVQHDGMLARMLVRPGGIIIYHDYGNPSVEVTGVLNRLCDQGWPIMHVEKTWLAFLRMPTPSLPSWFADSA